MRWADQELVRAIDAGKTVIIRNYHRGFATCNKQTIIASELLWWNSITCAYVIMFNIAVWTAFRNFPPVACRPCLSHLWYKLPECSHPICGLARRIALPSVKLGSGGSTTTCIMNYRWYRVRRLLKISASRLDFSKITCTPFFFLAIPTLIYYTSPTRTFVSKMWDLPIQAILDWDTLQSAF